MFLFKERREIGTTAAFEMELPLSPITFHQTAVEPRRASELQPWPTVIGQKAIDRIGTMQFKLCPPEGENLEGIRVLDRLSGRFWTF